MSTRAMSPQPLLQSLVCGARLRHQLAMSRGGRRLADVPTAVPEQEVARHQLAPDPASVPDARRLAVDLADPLMADEQRSRLDLAISEVVSNAVRHSGSTEPIRLVLTGKDGYLCVRVTDGGTGLVPRPGAMGSEP